MSVFDQTTFSEDEVKWIVTNQEESRSLLDQRSYRRWDEQRPRETEVLTNSLG